MIMLLLAQVSDSWTPNAITGTALAAVAAGLGFGGKWFLSLVSKLVDGQTKTIQAAAIEINTSSELRRMDMDQLERIAKAWESAQKQQAMRDEAWAKAQSACAMLTEEHRKHFEAELDRLRKKGED